MYSAATLVIWIRRDRIRLEAPMPEMIRNNLKSVKVVSFSVYKIIYIRSNFTAKLHFI